MRARARSRPAAGSFAYHLPAGANALGLLDHLVGPLVQRFGNGEAEPVGGLAIDHKTEMGWLLERQIGWFGTLQDSADKIGHPLGGFAALGAVRHQPPVADHRRD